MPRACRRWKNLFVLPDGDEPADVRDRVLLRAHEHGVGLGQRLVDDVRERDVSVARVALANEPRVLGEAGDVENELLSPLTRSRADALTFASETGWPPPSLFVIVSITIETRSPSAPSRR